MQCTYSALFESGLYTMVSRPNGVLTVATHADATMRLQLLKRTISHGPTCRAIYTQQGRHSA